MAHRLGSTDGQQRKLSGGDEQQSSEGTGSGRSLISRRSYLRLGVAATGALSSTIVGKTQARTTERAGIQFSEIQGAVADLGMDPTGRNPINQAIEPVPDGALITFPDGTYRLDTNTHGGLLEGTHQGFEAVGDDVTFVPPSGHRGYLIDGDGMEAAYFDGIDIDQTAANTCVGLRLCGDRVVVRNVEVLGGCDRTDGGVPMLSHATVSSNGESVVENVVNKTGGGVQPMLGRPGVFVESSHRGTVTIQDCDLREFSDAAVHATRHSGAVHVVDSQFKDNASSVRLSGSGSSITQCDIGITNKPYPTPPGVKSQKFRFHGISIGETGTVMPSRQSNPITLEKTTVRIADGSFDGPAIAVTSDGPPLEVTDCDIEYDSDGSEVILGQSPAEKSGHAPIRQLRLEDVSITGDGSVDTAIVIGNADGSTIRNSSILLPRSQGDGLSVRNSEDCLVTESDLSVLGMEAVFKKASVQVQNLSRAENGIDSETLESCDPHRLLFDAGDRATLYEFTAPQHSPNGQTDRGLTRQVVDKVTEETDSYRFGGTLESLALRGTGSISFDNGNGL